MVYRNVLVPELYSSSGLTRVQTGLRVDEKIIPAFRQLCEAEGFKIGEAVEAFMRGAVQTKSVKLALDGAVRVSDAQRRADILNLKTIMANLKSLIEAGRIEFEEVLMSGVYKEKVVMGAVDLILRVFPRIEDRPVQDEASKAVEEAMKYVGEERRFNTRKRSILH